MTEQSIEDRIERAVERAVKNLLTPYLRRICEPEPATYTATQAAAVLQVGPDTVSRLVRRGVLGRLPHVDGKLLIPRASVERLLAAAEADDPSVSVLRTASGP